jgi:hypothetical protein
MKCSYQTLPLTPCIIASPTSTYSDIPKHRLTGFVDREGELAQVAAYFTHTSDRPRISILCALGGQRNSQIALEYCRQTRDTYAGVFWVNGTSESTLLQSFARIAEIVDAPAVASPEEDEKTQFVLRRLAQWEHRWLMVFDNCDDPVVFPRINALIPEGAYSHSL